jgi:hypothetical protein
MKAILDNQPTLRICFFDYSSAKHQNYAFSIKKAQQPLLVFLTQLLRFLFALLFSPDVLDHLSIFISDQS